MLIQVNFDLIRETEPELGGGGGHSFPGGCLICHKSTVLDKSTTNAQGKSHLQLNTAKQSVQLGGAIHLRIYYERIAIPLINDIKGTSPSFGKRYDPTSVSSG